SWRVRSLCLLIPRPPRSPPFPYTTLFRSLPSQGPPTPRRVRRCDGRALRRAVVLRRSSRRRRPTLCRYEIERWLGLASLARHGTDRKSTRLNSSHVKISYAVFCLKQKRYA